MERKTRISDVIKALGTDFKVRAIEAYCTSQYPLRFQAVTDNALQIGDNNLMPLGERFGVAIKDAVIYRKKDGEITEETVQIEIDNEIKQEDLFVLLEFDTGETCKYLVLDKI